MNYVGGFGYTTISFSFFLKSLAVFISSSQSLSRSGQKQGRSADFSLAPAIAFGLHRRHGHYYFSLDHASIWCMYKYGAS